MILYILILVYIEIAIAFFVSLLVSNFDINIVNYKTDEIIKLVGVERIKWLAIISILWIVFIFKISRRGANE